MFVATNGIQMAETLKSTPTNRLRFIARKNLSVAWEAPSVDWKNAPENGTIVKNLDVELLREILVARKRNLLTSKIGKFTIILELKK
jgi:hypothetical protein